MSQELNALREKLTSAEWKELARIAETSPAYLWQIATGRRRGTAEMAAKIEAAAREVCPDTTLTKEAIAFAPLQKSKKKTPPANDQPCTEKHT